MLRTILTCPEQRQEWEDLELFARKLFYTWNRAKPDAPPLAPEKRGQVTKRRGGND